jgi:hypothetical protein
MGRTAPSPATAVVDRDLVSGPLNPDERMAAVLTVLVQDRDVRRYLALHDPATLHQAQRALAAWMQVHGPVPVA